MNKTNHEQLSAINLSNLDAVTGGFPGSGLLHKAWDKTKQTVKQGVDYARKHPEIFQLHNPAPTFPIGPRR